MKCVTWQVWLKGLIIDTVMFDTKFNIDDVYEILVEYKGMNPLIRLRIK